jgi:hypothetical protein
MLEGKLLLRLRLVVVGLCTVASIRSLMRLRCLSHKSTRVRGLGGGGCKWMRAISARLLLRMPLLRRSSLLRQFDSGRLRRSHSSRRSLW